MIKYNKDVICILKKSEEEMFESNSKLVDINHLILATLKLNNNVKKLLNKYNITYNSYKEKLNISKKSDSSKLIFYSINLKKILDLSYDTANRYSSNEIFIEHIFITIINENIDVQLFKDLDENLEDFYKFTFYNNINIITKIININKNNAITNFQTFFNHLIYGTFK